MACAETSVSVSSLYILGGRGLILLFGRLDGSAEVFIFGAEVGADIDPIYYVLVLFRILRF